MQRLQTRPQFQAVLAGAVVAKTVHFVLHRNALDARAPQAPDSKKNRDNSLPAGDTRVSPASLFPHDCTWMGAMVPKRWAKRAVTRNAIKRQIYTLSAGFEDQYPVAAFVVRLRREFSRQQFVSATSAPLKEAVRHEVLALLQAGLAASRPAAHAQTA
ncbi:MAG: ribonuclease P protein component [Comamonadaceae bacterium]|nr:MAG: ribonuclease P protein component [Comamonadaceae bacterium]